MFLESHDTTINHDFFLGCGPSKGVPSMDGDWGDCCPTQPLNRRSRSGLAFSSEKETWLIDTPPDLRLACLRHNIRSVAGVFCTHAHFDHIGGLEDLRGFNAPNLTPIYSDLATLNTLGQRCPYAFPASTGWNQAFLKAVPIDGPFVVGPNHVIPFVQDHGYSTTLGFRFGNWAYSTDFINLPAPALSCLENLDLWIVSCLEKIPKGRFPTHAHLDKVLKWIDDFQPKRAILTHMGPQLDYDDLMKILPAHVIPAHDHLVVTV